MARRASGRSKLAAYFREHPGEVLNTRRLIEISGITSAARRARELRQMGWPIKTHHDRRDLKPGEWVLDGDPPETDNYTFTSAIPARVRAQVLDRNGGTCQMCGAMAGEPDDINPGRTIRMHIGHIEDRDFGGDVDPANLRALCNRCNEGAKNLTAAPPTWVRLLSQIRRATISDQRRARDWLVGKFSEGG